MEIIGRPTIPVIAIPAMTEIANHADTPWPSLQTAGWLFDWASWTLVASLLVGAISTVLIVWTGTVKEHHWDLSRETANAKIVKLEIRAAELKIEANKASEAAAIARRETKQVDINLLREQRLNSDERHRLRRLESAMLPRAELTDQNTLVQWLRNESFNPINIAVAEGSPETLQYGLVLRDAFQAAGKLKGFFLISTPLSGFTFNSSGGTTMLAADEDATRISEALWHKFGLGGGVSSLKINKPGLEAIPKDTNCLFVQSRGPVLGPAGGKSGEGLDEHDRPLPPE